jgi:1,4-dihydroxy-2-naphthoate octaprenyltransferase
MTAPTIDATERTRALDASGGLAKLATYPFQVLTFVDADGYPLSVAVEATIDPATLSASFQAPAGISVPAGAEISLTGSHIRPQPGYGYDERRHVTVWGRVDPQGEMLVLTSTGAWGWDEQDLPFFEYSERSTGRARRYFDALSAERGTPVKPRLGTGWLLLRATRLPFLTATIVPVVLGIVIAAAHGAFDLVAAALTIAGAAFVQLGLNVANDVFDTVQGADDANVTPTRYSGGSRVIQYGLLSVRQMALLSGGFYVAGIATGLLLLAYRGSVALLVIGVVGIVVSVAYTAAPLKLVYRGLGEIAVALGFGPLMVLGAYVVQTRGTLAWEPFVISVPIALLVAMILYVNEIPDRRGDARAGKRTLPVRFGRESVVRGYDVSVAAAYGTLVLGVVAGVLPVPVLLAMATVPLALRVHRGLLANYDNPYGLMALMAVNIQLHLAAGGLLLAAYVVVLLVAAFLPGAPLFLR